MEYKIVSRRYRLFIAFTFSMGLLLTMYSNINEFYETYNLKDRFPNLVAYNWKSSKSSCLPPLPCDVEQRARGEGGGFIV